MSKTVAIIAAPADADMARTLARELSSTDCTCVLDPPSIESAPTVVIVCSALAEPTTAMAGLVERAFNRRARLLPVLIDLEQPPPQVAHFLAGLRCLESARAELPAAASRLRDAIARLPDDRPAIPLAAPAVDRQPRASRSIDLNTWSRVARSAALLSAAFAAWRLLYDVAALRGVPGHPDAFGNWARSSDMVSMLHAPFALALFISVAGWLTSAIRDLVLAHRERQVRSWMRIWGGYLLALVYPPLAVRTISRVWAGLADDEGRPAVRAGVVAAWWAALMAATVFPMVAMFAASQSALDLAALAAEPPPPDVQRRILWLFATGNAAHVMMCALTIVIVRGRRTTRVTSVVSPPAAGAPRLAVLVLSSRDDRLLADVLGHRLWRHGVDLYAREQGSTPDPGAYDAILVLGRGRDSLPDLELAILERTIEAGHPVFPVSWKSDSPPAHLQARLGPLHWHTTSFDDDSIRRLAAALLKSPRRIDRPAPSATRLGTTPGPRVGVARAAVGVLVLAVAWSLASLGRSLAEFDLQILVLLARGDEMQIDEASLLRYLLVGVLGWRVRALLPAAAAAVGLVWVFSTLKVHETITRATRPVLSLFDTRNGPRRSAEWLVAALAAAWVGSMLNAPAFALTGSIGLSLGLSAVLFATVAAARRRLRSFSRYWDADPAAAPVRMAAAPRSWLAPLAVTGLIGVCAIVAVALVAALAASTSAASDADDREALAAAQLQAQATVPAALLLVHLPAAFVWWWWLARRTREARRAGNAGISRARRALALVPLAGHVDLPDIVRDLTAHRYHPASIGARAAHALASVVALAWTASVLWLLSAAWAGDHLIAGRAIAISTMAFLVFASASILLSWAVGLVRGTSAIETDTGLPGLAGAAIES